MTVLPPEIKFGRVVGRWIKAIADTVDADELPEAVAAAGQGTLTPVKQRDLLPDTVQNDGTYLGLLFSSYSVVLNSDGELCMDHARDKVGVVVPVGFYEISMEIQGTTWPKFTIEVTEENDAANPVDLIRWTPIEVTPTVQIAASVETAERAEAAALRAETAADGMIISGSVVGDNLVLTKNDATTVVAGNVRGPRGPEGPAGDPGTPGRGITSIADPDLDGVATVTYTDTTTSTLPLPAGPAGTTTWAGITDKPDVIAAGATAADARTAIGAGTSNLTLGGTATDAAPGNHDHDSRYYTELEADGRFIRTVNDVGPDAGGNVTVSGGGGSTPTLAAGLFHNKQQTLTGDALDNGCFPALGCINILVFSGTVSRPLKKLMVRVATAASASTLVEYGFYSADTLTLITSMGTVDISTTGAKTMTLAEPVTLPPLFILAQRLRSSALNGGALRRGVPPDSLLNLGMNPWDDVNAALKPFGVDVAGYDALPATLPATGWRDAGSSLPFCSIMAA